MTRAGDWSEAALGYSFRDQGLLEQALTHRSAAASHNERLEFLGDALLGMVIAMELYRSRPDLREGALTRMRASLVRRETLAALATELGLGDILQLDSGVLRSGGHHNESILADAVEALFGAVLLDGGFPAAQAAIQRVFADRLETLPDAADLKDAKTRLQEWLQARGLPTPEYELVGETGPAHNRRFSVECRITSMSIRQSGSAGSRRRAEQIAAAAVIDVLPDE